MSSKKVERDRPDTAGTPGRGPGRPPLDHEQLRRQVLDTARRLFAERSFAGVTVSRLIDAAGVSAGSFYRLFDDKESVLHTLLEEVLESNRLEVQAQLTDDPDPVTRLHDYVRVVIDISRETQQHVLGDLKRILANGLPPALADFPAYVDSLTEMVVRELLEGVRANGQLALSIEKIDDAAPLIVAICDKAVLEGRPTGRACADFVLRAVLDANR
jgi:AcrR family transcriptional regulator